MVDLHMHSIFSDGTFTPEELVERAFKNNIKVMAITDHDNIDGLKRGQKKAKELGIIFINGIEISANYKGKDIHILGYFLDLEDNNLISWLNDLQEKRYNRILKILEKLKKLGIEISIKEAIEESTGNIIGRPHIAKLIIKKGFAKDMDEAFSKYLGDGKPGYVPKVGVEMVSVVEKLKSNGAIVSLAHPHLISYPYDTLINIIDLLVKSGLDALELYYPNINIKIRNKLIKLAKKRNLILTGGSDFHGLNRANVDIGIEKIPMEVYEVLVNRKKT